jgi:hypothetical protein
VRVITRPIGNAIVGLAIALIAYGAICAMSVADEPSPRTAEAKAVAFLAVEVPRWVKENACYSCHNNGDAARALLTALKSGDLADRAPLEDTLAFLSRPEKWDANGPEGPFKDKKLARIQFAAALVDAIQSRAIEEGGQLARAAALVAELQMPDGGWEVDAAGNIGSPVTYGRVLATRMAVATLAAADRAKYRAAIAKAQGWLEATEPRSVLDAAATMLALTNVASPAAERQRTRSLEIIRQGESAEGGWGPFVNSPPEAFDTALVLLALRAQKQPTESTMIARGRKYLLAAQNSDGSWRATTRPRGVDSYAQQLSTTAWATQALLATRGRK